MPPENVSGIALLLWICSAAIDGLDFKLTQETDLMRDYRLGDGFKMMNLQDIENTVSPSPRPFPLQSRFMLSPPPLQYNVDFTKWRSLVNQT